LAILALALVALGVVLHFSKSRSPFWALTAKDNLPALEISHPIEGAVMPLNMPAPVLVWNTNGIRTDHWAVGFGRDLKPR